MRGSDGRITIVVPGLGAGGTEHVVSLIANHWLVSGFSVTVITFETRGSVPYYHFEPDISIVRLNIPNRRSSSLQSSVDILERVRRLRSAIRASRPDFVLSFLTRTNVMTLLATIGMEIPVVVSERNNPALQPFGQIWNRLRSRVYPRAFGLVTMTEGALNYFPAQMRRRGWVIANAVNLPQGWQRRRGNNILTAASRLTHQKGFDLLLQAFASTAARHPEWTLEIWGEGNERGRLEAQRDGLGLT
ncbi:glycosyltransferase, partial [Sinorhizobium fredii]|uniref:glycosyltransferase n=1 Tax=Rhizobium fredii TaxID=380 RepID=UPI0012FD003D